MTNAPATQPVRRNLSGTEDRPVKLAHNVYEILSKLADKNKRTLKAQAEVCILNQWECEQ